MESKTIGYIKCPKCGETYFVEEDDFEDGYVSYTCDKCGNNFCIDFIVHCSVCNAYVGAYSNLTLKQAAKEFGKGVIDMYIHPIDSIKSIGHLFDKKIPYSHGVASCQFCGTKYARCPNCHSGVEVEDGVKTEDVLFCTECGQKFRLQ